MGLSRGKLCCLALVGLVALAGAAILAVLLTRSRCAPPRYPRAAVAADTQTCSDIGRDILKQGGSAVDATIAALICTAVLNPQSMGLGGGVIFTIYNASTGKVEVLNARERAPQNISGNLMAECSKKGFPVGSRWIAVPGELRGYEEAHRRYGKLPWKTLFEPTIKILDPGIRIPEVLGRFLSHPFIQPYLNKTALRKLFYNKQGAALGAGDLLRWPALVETLRAVAEKGANEFYRGTTAEKLVQDIVKEGSALSLRDLRDYRVEVMSPVNISLGEYTVYSAPRPAAGPILLFILNVLKGFNFTKESMSTPSQSAETYHYIAETLKFANGQRVKVDDPVFSRTGKDVLSELISDSFASQVRQQIDERGDHPASHYDSAQVGRTSFGTSHVSVLAEDGSAVSATSTINYPFGSMVYSPQTGIILNNELADFCMKKSSDRISPGEMPPSSMTPSILISRDGQSKLVVGGSGGQLIIPAVALTIANKLFFGYDVDKAIKAPILFVNSSYGIEVEKSFDKSVEAALKQKGHAVKTIQWSLNVVQAVSKDGPCLFPYSDLRKNGQASGY
ncbi:glutathione hydrolase 5 proenzyme isoform X1 [Podarcis lilfordi]|uniref:Glutathione hydrolase 5 proenzyme isoform X1 n=1 Tax=Podarcis lilfordi TaxID=74358 RepID=A0AA35LKZ2_9SAUR|nr:glutathione hydrolase 5 proenzyme isoform X1 [Podarcis lilfordi]